jgi:hypothetical protein
LRRLPGARNSGGELEPLGEAARAYARAVASRHTNRAYGADWRDCLRWRSRQGLDLRPLADPECVGLYLAALASGGRGADGKARTVATIERRLSALAWNIAQRCLPFDRKNRHVATLLAGVRRAHGRLSVQKEALLPERLIAMLDALPPPIFATCATGRSCSSASPAACAARKSSALSAGPEDSLEGSGWPEFFDDGVLFTLRGKTTGAKSRSAAAGRRD